MHRRLRYSGRERIKRVQRIFVSLTYKGELSADAARAPINHHIWMRNWTIDISKSYLCFHLNYFIALGAPERYTQGGSVKTILILQTYTLKSVHYDKLNSCRKMAAI